MNELRLPRVKRSICGCSLETAAKIVSYIHLIGLVGGFVTVLFFEFSTERVAPRGTANFGILFYRDELMFAAIFNITVVAGLYLYGIKKRETIFMEPFLITKGSTLILDLFNLGLSVLARAFQYKTIALFIDLFAFVMDSYMFTILHSFYQEVRDNGPPAQDTNDNTR